MLQEIESALVARLKTALPGFAVEPFPDRPEAYRLLSTRGAALVVYRGSGLSPTRDSGIIVQERTLRFDVTLLSRDLRSHAGAYAMMGAAYTALLGYAPPHCGQIWFERDGFVGQNDGVWQYDITLAMRSVAVAEVDYEGGPLLVHATALDDYDNVEVAK